MTLLTDISVLSDLSFLHKAPNSIGSTDSLIYFTLYDMDKWRIRSSVMDINHCHTWSKKGSVISSSNFMQDFCNNNCWAPSCGQPSPWGRQAAGPLKHTPHWSGSDMMPVYSLPGASYFCFLHWSWTEKKLYTKTYLTNGSKNLNHLTRFVCSILYIPDITKYPFPNPSVLLQPFPNV